MSEPQPSTSPDVQSLLSREALLGHLQPFGDDICASWHEAEDSVSIHEAAFEELRAQEVQGKVVLLNAPRAGHGKTHLLGRVAGKLNSEAAIASLPWQTLDGLTWEKTGRGIIQDLARTGDNPNSLERLCAGILATLLRRLIQTGRIPSTDPAQALRVLSQDPMELFQESGNARVIGDWFRKHFEQLRHALAEISNVEDIPIVENWLQAMFDYLGSPTAGNLTPLLQQFTDDTGMQASRFFRLATAWKPLVLVADHMDGLYRNAEAGMEVTRMALSLINFPLVRVVLSMNQDLWETTFGRQLPSALEDRLSARNVSLRGLSVEEAKSLVTMRLSRAEVPEADQTSFLSYLNLDLHFSGRTSTTPRGVLRHASTRWREWLRDTSEATEAKAKVAAAPLEPDPVIDAGPLPMLDEDLHEDDSPDAWEALSRSLAEEAGAKHVDIANLAPAPTSLEPPPQAVPLPQNDVMEAESFLIDTPPPPPSSSPPPLSSTATPPPLPGATSDFLTNEPEAAGNFPPAPEDFLLDGPGNAIGSEVGGNYDRLRSMLSKLRTPQSGDAENPVTGSAFTAPPVAQATTSAPATPSTFDSGSATSGSEANVSLHDRFETLRQEVLRTGQNGVVDHTSIGELVRLAGKRFPVVTYDEVELPGLLGKSLPRWTLQGLEIVFGLEPFSNLQYWRTVVSFFMGRLAELQTAASQSGMPAPILKFVVFKGDHDGPSLMNLLQQEVIPTTLRSRVDAVNLDAHSIASLQAMCQLVRESESSTSPIEPGAVPGAMASELDFFWKRITRQKA